LGTTYSWLVIASFQSCILLATGLPHLRAASATTIIQEEKKD
jgi:hypothetical protein